MINHVRTLLMNRTREGFPRSYPGEEYIDPLFVPKQLSNSLELVQTALFGGNPDRLFINYRMRQLMAMLHSTELGQFAADKDSRITYLPFTDKTDFFDKIFGITVDTIENTDGLFKLYLMRDSVVDDPMGRAYRLWTVSVQAGQITIERRSPPAEELVLAVENQDGLSQEFTLIGDAIRARVKVADGLAIWNIEARSRPTKSGIEALRDVERAMGAEGVGQFFGSLPDEPVATYKRIWNDHPHDAYRYGALLLAIAEQVEQRPQVT